MRRRWWDDLTNGLWNDTTCATVVARDEERHISAISRRDYAGTWPWQHMHDSLPTPSDFSRHPSGFRPWYGYVIYAPGGQTASGSETSCCQHIGAVIRLHEIHQPSRCPAYLAALIVNSETSHQTWIASAWSTSRCGDGNLESRDYRWRYSRRPHQRCCQGRRRE